MDEELELVLAAQHYTVKDLLLQHDSVEASVARAASIDSGVDEC
jgi:hypothetical protein